MADPLIGGRYRILRELGRGGMGVVYLVEHMRTGDQLALKLLLGEGARDGEVIARFKREARASARIKSENVVKVVDADVAPELDGAPFLVMELLNGTDLDKQLRKDGPMPAGVALHYLNEAARALDKSHAMGIVHRDLKPENLFVHHREDGTTILKILDFGISKIVGGDANDIMGAGMTRSGAVMGTPLYMAPEQARGQISQIGPGTDVWAMGLIALQLLTGEIYWQANTVAELIVHILSDPFYMPSQRWASLPPAIDAWFLRSCARNPRDRFPSVGMQIHELGVVLGALPKGTARLSETAGATLTAPVGRWPTLDASTATAPLGARTTTSATAGERSEPRRNSKGFWAALAVLVLGGVGAGAWILRHHPQLGGPLVAPRSTEATTWATVSAEGESSAAHPASSDGSSATVATSASATPVEVESGAVARGSAVDAGRANRPDAGKPIVNVVVPQPTTLAVTTAHPAAMTHPTVTSTPFNPAAP